MDIQRQLTAFAMLGATWVMWLLVILSVIGLTIVLERAYYLLSSMGNFEQLRAEVRRYLEARNGAADRRQLARHKSFEAKVALAGLDAVHDGPAAAEERMAVESQRARMTMERNVAFLGTVGNNAPFVGLLGTVIGVIRAFHELDAAAGQVTRGLMTEIGEALVATAIGILVALPAVAFYNLYQRIIRRRLQRAESLSREILAFLKSTSPAGSVKAE